MMSPSAEVGMAADWAEPSWEAPPVDREDYDHIEENDFVAVADQPLSTFGVDVDTASYSNVRRFLSYGQLPPADAVRLEELVNYFEYDYAEPAGEHPFSVTAEIGPCPWNDAHRLVHLGIQGKHVQQDEVPPRNLVFLVDVSASMDSPDKLGLLKTGLRMLADDLREQDRVALVVYAGASGVVLRPTNDRAKIKRALRRLRAGGSTAGAAGLQLAYEVATRNFQEGAINRVILASDGDFNVGPSSQGELVDLIERKRESGVFLSVLGFGTGNLNDAMMEQVADHGNGNYAYIDNEQEARRVLVEQANATLVPIAKDVKLQVELNPAVVEAYRLLGYENRRLEAQDFNDDRKDAGELGAGHTVTAIYEIRLQPGEHPQLGTLRVRYKTPRASASTALERKLPGTLVRGSWAEAAPPTQLSVVAAAYAEKLRGSYWVRNLTWSEVQGLYAQIDASLRSQPEVGELGRLIDVAARLDRRSDKFEADLPLARMDFDRVPVLE
ncbi:MAG: VWA domain-containing protein [Myxococcales bacterium]|nr:VWA domain-containing protein [Myxococcales bacterium]